MFIVTYFWCKRDLVLGSDKTVASSHLNPFMIHFSPWQYASFRDEAQKLSFEKVFSSIYMYLLCRLICLTFFKHSWLSLPTPLRTQLATSPLSAWQSMCPSPAQPKRLLRHQSGTNEPMWLSPHIRIKAKQPMSTNSVFRETFQLQISPAQLPGTQCLHVHFLSTRCGIHVDAHSGVHCRT